MIVWLFILTDMKTKFHIKSHAADEYLSDDEVIELKRGASSKVSVKSLRKYFVMRGHYPPSASPRSGTLSTTQRDFFLTIMVGIMINYHLRFRFYIAYIRWV